MTQVFHDARDLWAAQGLPYYEPDRIVTTSATVVRELLHVGHWRARFELQANAEIIPAE